MEEPEGMEDAKNTVSYINMNKAPMNSQRLKQNAQALHRSVPGTLCIYHGFLFRVFMGFLNEQTCESLIRVLYLRHFSSCRFVLSNFYVIVFFFFGLVTLSFVILFKNE